METSARTRIAAISFSDQEGPGGMWGLDFHALIIVIFFFLHFSLKRLG